MNQQEFMQKLKNLLKRLPHEEFSEAIDYYEQYFAEGGEVKETPEQVARGILADFAVGADDPAARASKGKTETKSGTKIWIIILSIFSIPILVPIGAALFAVAIALFAVIFALLVSGGAIIFAGFVGAIASLIFLIASPATTLFFIGYCLLSVALGILFIKLTTLAAKASSKWILNLFNKILRRNNNE
jgi:uncharacterized membrane protein